MVPLALPMVPLAPTFPPMVTSAPMVSLAAEKRSGFSSYQWYHFPMVQLGESRTPAPLGLPTTNGTNGTNVSTNGNIGTNGTIGCRETFRLLGLPMVRLATNGSIGKISNGNIGRIPNARSDRVSPSVFRCTFTSTETGPIPLHFGTSFIGIGTHVET